MEWRWWWVTYHFCMRVPYVKLNRVIQRELLHIHWSVNLEHRYIPIYDSVLTAQPFSNIAGLPYVTFVKLHSGRSAFYLADATPM